MLYMEKLQRCNTPKLVKLFLLYLALIALIFPSTILAAASHPCENASRSLRADLDVVSSRGGIWSLMEQRGLKKESTSGMIADSRLAIAVGQFETLCESEKKPGKQLFIEIETLLGEARSIFNPKSSGEELKQSINKLIKELDSVLAKMK